MGGRKRWSPERRDIIWIDCNPHSGREMKDPMKQAPDDVFVQACEALNQIIAIGQ